MSGFSWSSIVLCVFFRSQQCAVRVFDKESKRGKASTSDCESNNINNNSCNSELWRRYSITSPLFLANTMRIQLLALTLLLGEYPSRCWKTETRRSWMKISLSVSLSLFYNWLIELAHCEYNGKYFSQILWFLMQIFKDFQDSTKCDKQMKSEGKIKREESGS